MRRATIALVFIALLSLAPSAFGGAVYVPVARDAETRGVRIETHLFLSNQGDAGRSVGTLFFAADADGTDREDLEERRIGVPAKATVFVGDAAPDGGIGLFEIVGVDAHAVQAHLVSSLGDVRVDEEALPVVSSDNDLPAGVRVHLLPLSRTAAGLGTELYILNLGLEAATCTVSNFRSSGVALAAASELEVAPFAVHRVADALADAGPADLVAARSTVSCDQSFYALAVVTDARDGDLTVVQPAEPGSSTLFRPGDQPPGPVCPAGGECFETLGAFFVPTRSSPERTIVLPVTPNREYKQIVVELEVTHNGWYSRIPDGIHRIFWLTRNNGIYDRHTFAALTTRGPNRNLVRLEVTADLRAGEELEFTESAALVPGTIYLVRTVFDGNTGVATTTLTDKATGQVAVTVAGGGATNRVRTEATTWSVTVSDTEEGVHAVSQGWVYSNLRVQFLP